MTQIDEGKYSPETVRKKLLKWDYWAKVILPILGGLAAVATIIGFILGWFVPNDRDREIAIPVSGPTNIEEPGSSPSIFDTMTLEEKARQSMPACASSSMTCEVFEQVNVSTGNGVVSVFGGKYA